MSSGNFIGLTLNVFIASISLLYINQVIFMIAFQVFENMSNF